MTTSIDTNQLRTTLDSDEPDIAMICDCLTGALPLRDAVLALIVDPTIGDDALRLITDDPHSRQAADVINRVLARTFHDVISLDVPRIRRIATVIATEADIRKDARLHAASAYLYWMIREHERAALHALTALSMDDRIQLATIVLTGIEQGFPRD
ncbi:hypothetical protein [Bifidobacterium aerophilum]|uniref:DUF4192 family protein n=1 Tax=Bifidobacterium aerophilum TaxID=1798155 RepID=A0A6N9Z7L2_9BIFI|nr:hypothetical protein [Bifidobacterium aerophilum]NEG90491.1 hypothetical protein [Bifidobacterium aerophilum]